MVILAVKKKDGKIASICKTPGTIYLDPEKDLNTNIESRHGQKIKYRKGSCEERYPCYDWKRMACYSTEGELDNSYKEATEIRDLSKAEGSGNTRSVNRIVKKLRNECNEKKGHRWDNSKKDDYRYACIADGESKMKQEYKEIKAKGKGNFDSAPVEARENFRDKWYVTNDVLKKLKGKSSPPVPPPRDFAANLRMSNIDREGKPLPKGVTAFDAYSTKQKRVNKFNTNNSIKLTITNITSGSRRYNCSIRNLELYIREWKSPRNASPGWIITPIFPNTPTRFSFKYNRVIRQRLTSIKSRIRKCIEICDSSDRISISG